MLAPKLIVLLSGYIYPYSSVGLSGSTPFTDVIVNRLYAFVYIRIRLIPTFPIRDAGRV
jgi:hypothetical protein